VTSPVPSTPSDPPMPPEIFRTPDAVRYLSLFVTLLLAAVSAFMIVMAILLLFAGSWGMGVFFAAVATFMAALDGYVLRDLRGRWGLRVELLGDRMVLNLPGGRSLIHRPVAQQLTVPYSDVEAVETRLEAFPSLGMESMQRAYVLSLKQGKRIFLFEDRALGTQLAIPLYGRIAGAIVARANVPLRDLGMVEGGGGFLSMWGAHAPDWAAPSLPLAQQLRIWRHAASTGSLAIGIVILAVIIRASLH
jgi:hypothetical protein